MHQLDVAALIVWYLVFVFSTTFHEFSHAYLAYRGGDSTAYEGGQMSLDPIPHIRRSPFGMVLVPLLSFYQLGWMIGWASTPFDPQWGARNPRKQALMSLAGPVSNFLLAGIGLFVIWLLLRTGVFEVPHSVSFTKIVALPEGTEISSPLGALSMGLSVLVNLNLLLGVFNLIPIPPLDGAGVLEGFAPRATAPLYDKMRETPMFQFAGLILAWYLFAGVPPRLVGFVLTLLYG